MKINKKPRISVITPSYNQAKFLRQTIESVLQQKYPNLQYIVIDGGSTDGSVDIIKEYSENIYYWTCEPDKGQSDAINKGLAIADGDVVTWINSDDLLMPGALAIAGKAWADEPELSLLSGECIRIGQNNEFLGWHVVPKQTKWFARRGLVYIDQPGTFWKNGIIAGLNFVDSQLECLMDHDLWYRIAIAGGKTRRIKVCTAAFRYHSKSKSTNIQHIFQAEATLLRKRYCNNSGSSMTIPKLVYRLWKSVNGDYLRQGLYSKFPPKKILDSLHDFSPLS